jgi:hypothetical protein
MSIIAPVESRNGNINESVRSVALNVTNATTNKASRTEFLPSVLAARANACSFLSTIAFNDHTSSSH